MSLNAFIRQCFDMNRKDLLSVINDLTPEEVAWRPAGEANSIGFILWHMARVEDAWVQRPIQGKKHLWVSDGWAVKFGMPEDQRDMGHGYTVQQLDAFKTPSLDLLMGYSDAVRKATLAFLETWDPVKDNRDVKAAYGTITVKDVFATLIWELNQHGGQVAYVKGLKRGLQRPQYMGPLSIR